MDDLATAFGLGAPGLNVVVWVEASQLLTVLLRRPIEPGQYVSGVYQATLVEHGVRPSVGRPGTAWDNAVAESFFATLKQELLYRHAWPTRQAARTAIFGFIEGWYNRTRLHSTLHYCSPTDYEEAYDRLILAA